MGDVGVDDIRAVIRTKLVAGDLPSETPVKCWVGKGTDLPCMGCGLPISPEGLEYELDLPVASSHPVTMLRLHQACVRIWHEERAGLRLKQ
jgi:hypothetical protein